MALGSRIISIARTLAASYVLFIALGIVIGVTLAPVAWNAATEPDGTVAVVPVAGTIDGQTAAEYSAMLRKARNDGDVEAVVLVSNSGGGGAAASEEMYLQTKRTANQMPVVTSIDGAAASGAYYTIAPSDYIYAKPSSTVGSIGVLATLPQDLEPNDIVATTGPNKLSGGDEREFFYILDSLRNAFVNAVYAQRSDQLTMSKADLSEARVWGGAQAVQNGLADDIGDRQAAIQKAANLAGMDRYEVKLLTPNGTARFVSRSNYLNANVEDKEMVSIQYFTGDQTGPPVFLMMPASYAQSDAADAAFVHSTALADAATTADGTTETPVADSPTTETPANETATTPVPTTASGGD